MKLEDGLPRFLKFFMPTFSYSSGRETMKWTSRADAERYKEFSGLLLDLGFLIEDQGLKFFPSSPWSCPHYYLVCGPQIPWPFWMSDDKKWTAIIAIKSEKEEYRCLLEYLLFSFFCSATNQSPKIPNVKEVLDYQISMSDNKKALWEFISRNHPAGRSEIEKMFLHKTGHSVARLCILTDEIESGCYNPEWVLEIIAEWIEETGSILEKEGLLSPAQERNADLEIEVPIQDPFQKLKWKGSAAALLDVFNQLQKHESGIDATSKEIARMLKNTFTCFDTWDLENIQTELRRISGGKRPKRARMDLNFDE